MLDFESLLSGKPIPAVNASDLQRVWELTSGASLPESAKFVSWDIRLIASECSEGADPLAVSFRVGLLRFLLDHGLLDNWRDGDRPNDIVFQTLATYPLPGGLQTFRPDEFLGALKAV